MTKDKQIIAIAELTGYVWYRHPVVSMRGEYRKFLNLPAVQEYEQDPVWMVRADGTEKPCAVEYMRREFGLPNFPGDLNAMHEAWKAVIMPHPELRKKWRVNLKLLCAMQEKEVGFNSASNATSGQRAEVLLRTMGKWEEDSQ